MDNIWKVADAKNRFSELMNNALSAGPQTVKRRGERVIVLSGDEYDRLTGEKPGFKSMLMDGPTLKGVDLTRSAEPMREVKL